MNNEEQSHNGSMASIMKELSDIKASLAVNTNETANIKGSISEIKTDIKEIKNETVNRRELAEIVKGLKKEYSDADELIEEQIALLKKFVYGIVSVIGIAVLAAIINLVVITK